MQVNVNWRNHTGMKAHGQQLSDLTTLSYAEHEHVQSHKHIPVEWVWSTSMLNRNARFVVLVSHFQQLEA